MFKNRTIDRKKGCGLEVGRALFCVLILCFLSAKVFAQPKSDLWSFWNEADETSTHRVDHQLWGEILSEHLDSEHISGINRFNYADIDESAAQKLKGYINSLTEIDPRTFNKNEQFAYWVNLYNALTVEVVLTKYPISSITKIKKYFFGFGPWDMKITEIAGQSITLNDIEHRILRPIWNDYRIHFAVNCASLGCPSLQPEPFIASELEDQLNDSTTQYLMHPRGINFDDGALVLSEIFDWYKVDFGENQEEMFETLNPHLPLALSIQLKEYKGRIKYAYDWRLNEP